MKKFRFQLALKPRSKEEYEACVFLKGQHRKESSFVLGLLVEYLRKNKDVKDLLIEINEKIDRIEKSVDKKCAILNSPEENFIKEDILKEDKKDLESLSIRKDEEIIDNFKDEKDNSIDVFLNALK